MLWLRVPEMEVWTKYNRETKAFTEFLPPGRHWVWPWERIGDKISTQAKTVGGKCLKAQTEGGITAQVDWKATFRIVPEQIAPHLRSPLARALPQYGEKMVRLQGNNCTARAISELLVSALTENGNRGRLERMIREKLVERLHPFGIQVFRVMVTGVELPTKVVASYEEAHERTIFANSEAQAMERLHQAVSNFSDADMEKLLLLKQIQEMGKNGVAMYMQPIMPSFQSGSRPNGEVRDGRIPKPPAHGKSSGKEGGHGEWIPPAH